MKERLGKRQERESQGKEREKRKEAPLEMTSDEYKQFLEDDIVWAKIAGHPWWPAAITEKRYPTYVFDEGSSSYKKKEVIYRVQFFGQSSHAFLDEGKIAEYLPNREHFIELALKQNKKYSYENFKLSLKAADQLSRNPYEVNEEQDVILTPKKRKMTFEDEETSAKERTSSRDVKTEKKMKKPRIAHSQCKESEKEEGKLLFDVTQTHKKLSKYLLKLFISKNGDKYGLKILKKTIIRSLKKQKCLKKIDKNHIGEIMKWLEHIRVLNIDQIIEKYHKKSLKVTKNTPKTNNKIENHQNIHAFDQNQQKSSSTSYSNYLYISQLGNEQNLLLPLQKYDFQIVL